VDVYSAPKLRDTIRNLVEEGRYHIVVDLENVAFLDSTGLGVLVGGLKRVKHHQGDLGIICNQERILRIFRITGLTKVFTIYPSREDLLANIKGA
jgi:anti-sigma B factor antagonist